MRAQHLAAVPYLPPVETPRFVREMGYDQYRGVHHQAQHVRDLRGKGATAMYRAGVDIRLIQALLGRDRADDGDLLEGIAGRNGSAQRSADHCECEVNLPRGKCCLPQIVGTTLKNVIGWLPTWLEPTTRGLTVRRARRHYFPQNY